MKNLTRMVALLLLSAVVTTPAAANWFSSQKNNTMYNIGSIRNPTPQELRALYAKQEAERQARMEHRN